MLSSARTSLTTIRPIWAICGFTAALGACLSTHALGQESAIAAVPNLGPLTRVSVSPSGMGGIGGSSRLPNISGDGRYVAYQTTATNLLPGFPGGLFLHDRLTGKISVVNVNYMGTADVTSSHPSLSTDGRFVAFDSPSPFLAGNDFNNSLDVFVRDMVTGVTTKVSNSSTNQPGNLASDGPAISPDGRFVAFTSSATNLVQGDNNGVSDVFLHDRQTKSTTRISVSSTGAEGVHESGAPSVDRLGRHVAFHGSTDLDPGAGNILVRDLQTGTTKGFGFGGAPKISADGRFVTYSNSSDLVAIGDTNGFADVYVIDLQAGTTELASVSSQGQPGNGDSLLPSISSDGRYVTFTSNATNLEPGSGPGAFVRDRLTGTTQWLGFGSFPVISAEGRSVAFVITADNPELGDTNSEADVYSIDRLIPPTPGTWESFAGGTYGSHGKPTLLIDGAPQAGTVVTVALTNAPPLALALLIAADTPLALPVGKGWLLPNPTTTIPIVSDANGVASIGVLFPVLPPLSSIYLQFAVTDPTGANGLGFTLSNAVWGLSL